MCIVALAWQVVEGLPICLLSNRDEFYIRPTQSLRHWQDSQVIAGQDLQSGGTWMGITETGRWAVITNYRDASDQRTYPTSRGEIVADYLASNLPPIRFAQQLEQRQQDYAGFNLIVGDRQQAVYMSNRGEAPQVLAHGVYVMSNGLMSEYWAKTQHLRQRFVQEFLPLLALPEVSESDLQQVAWDILEDQRQRLPEQLPQTGIAHELEQLLSSTFIASPNYGTRCSNFLRCFQQHVVWLEKIQQGPQQGKIQRIEFSYSG
ncbi:NRDE family protein [Acinetobacter sp. ANC 3791]|uniref:NRDE family protein n=1 Tax=Acinetobacter sp. ANC 3791 TaxID=2529836 RepID=UPI001039A268|nr:NRDE family protein [Acinetobacter sp. ANC 3791]TCB84153.1 NRDE family protein [Acinetobacter sp. ANC 3791]